MARRIVDARLATLAGVVAARSALSLGYDGLAQRAGARTPDAFVSQITGTSATETRAITTVGSMINDPAPWMAEVASGVSDGALSVGAAAAIQTGLGAPSSSVAADDLADAAHSLLETAGSLPPEKVARAARERRDELNDAGMADREAHLRSKRALYLFPQSNGMTRISGLLDPESAALVTDAIDAVTSPKRGGLRFVDGNAAALARAIHDDPRSREQLALDALVEMIRIAVAADTGRVFGLRKPSVRVHVTAAGGCAVGTCERPPSWTEAHHIRHFQRDHGPTDIDNGILLCRHHHLLIHNNGWEIRRADTSAGDPGTNQGIEYLLEPPPRDRLTRTTHRLTPKNRAYRRPRKRRSD